MAGFSIEIKGLDDLIKRIGFDELKENLTDELRGFAANVQREAQQLAPVDEGHLKSSIGFEAIPGGFNIFVRADYAAFLEFGTRKYAAKEVAKLPADWKAFAAEFKGSGGGSLNEFIQRIMAWVQRKGFASIKTKSGNNSTSAASYDQQQQAAYWIAINILQNGIKAQPYLFPAWEKAKTDLFKDLARYGTIKNA